MDIGQKRKTFRATNGWLRYIPMVETWKMNIIKIIAKLLWPFHMTKFALSYVLKSDRHIWGQYSIYCSIVQAILVFKQMCFVFLLFQISTLFIDVFSYLTQSMYEMKIVSATFLNIKKITITEFLLIWNAIFWINTLAEEKKKLVCRTKCMNEWMNVWKQINIKFIHFHNCCTNITTTDLK